MTPLLAMSDAVALAVIGIANLVVTALLAMLREWWAARRAAAAKRELAEAVEFTSRKIAVVAEQVDTIEKATNSMKDALVLATKEKGELQGAKDERARAAQAKADRQET